MRQAFTALLHPLLENTSLHGQEAVLLQGVVRDYSMKVASGDSSDWDAVEFLRDSYSALEVEMGERFSLLALCVQDIVSHMSPDLFDSQFLALAADVSSVDASLDLLTAWGRSAS